MGLSLFRVFLIIRVGTTFFAAFFFLHRSRNPNLAPFQRTVGWRTGAEVGKMWLKLGPPGSEAPGCTPRKGAVGRLSPAARGGVGRVERRERPGVHRAEEKR